MKFRSFLFLLLSIGSLNFIACSKGDSGSDGSITLALNTKVGDKQVIATDIDQHITTKVMDQDLKIDQRIQMDMTLLTKEVRDTGKSFLVEGTFDRWAMKMDMNGAGMSNSAEFDTKDTTKNKGEMAPMMHQMFSKMIGQAFLMEMSRNGKVMNTNMQQVMEKIMPPGSSGSMTNDAMGTVPFPDHRIKPGDSWKDEVERDVAGHKTIYKADYTLKEVKDGIAHLTINGEIVNKTDSKKLGTLSGTYSVSTATGMLTDGNIKMLLDMEVDSPSGTKQPMKLDQTIKMTGKS